MTITNRYEYVYICSPYRGDVEKNVERARAYCKSATRAGFIPVAPHIYLTQFMDDNLNTSRRIALEMGLVMLEKCIEVWVFGDNITDGMRGEIEHAQEKGIPVKYWRG